MTKYNLSFSAFFQEERKFSSISFFQPFSKKLGSNKVWKSNKDIRERDSKTTKRNTLQSMGRKIFFLSKGKFTSYRQHIIRVLIRNINLIHTAEKWKIVNTLFFAQRNAFCPFKEKVSTQKNYLGSSEYFLEIILFCLLPYALTFKWQPEL